MTVNQHPSSYISQGKYTDPGNCAALFQGLPSHVEDLCGIIHGLLIHDYYGGVLYGDPPWDDHPPSRETCTVEQRLNDIMAKHELPLETARPVFERSVGTCRDFSLLLCSMLRHQGIPARVRCGFAAYFEPDWFEDHWLIEYWNADASTWCMADAQIDNAHRLHLKINFPTWEIPPDLFITAVDAWTLGRVGKLNIENFGKREASGEWFMHVNLVRDALSLQDELISDWDTWRNAPNELRQLSDDTRIRCDHIASLADAQASRNYVANPPWFVNRPSIIPV